jgi:hypothetical protein
MMVSLSLLGTGAARAAASDTKQPRFELTVQSGLESTLSGPDIDITSNIVGRFGFYPSSHFLITVTYEKWKSDVGSNSILGENFAQVYHDKIHSNLIFRDATLQNSTLDAEQWELGVQKVIPLGDNKHWQAYVLLGVGMQSNDAVIEYTGVTKRITTGPNTGQIVPLPPLTLDSELTTEQGVFFVSVAGGARWLPAQWIALEVEFRIVPIDEVFNQALNTMELNFGVVFRFGKF